jgi:aspartyl-tRNA synthetase
MSWRDLMCGEPRPQHVGTELTLAGWAARRRDHGGLVFVDLRDHTGVTQLVVNPEHAPEAAELAKEIRNEFVLRARGELVARSAETMNPAMSTGAVELQVAELEIVGRSTPLPFQLDEEGVDETLRLRYRWLDLRRDKLQRNLRLRARMVGIIRRHMEEAGFLDIQTPILFKPTPEGARDFVVPSRLHNGRFFALPQSPQILKQLTMVAGFDRYYQIAVCFRDEDLRADRVQEITQLDVELSFPEEEELFASMETMFARIWRECIGVEIATPWQRLTHAEADRRFASDKPDTRCALEVEDATELTRDSEFGVFAGAAAVRFLRVARTFSRAEIAGLEELARIYGAKGLAYLARDAESGELRSPIAKFLSEPELDALAVRPGETLLFAAGEWADTSRVLGPLRLHLGRELELIDEESFAFLWVTDFPMFEWDEDEGRFGAVHHPFTRPTDEWRDRFADEPAAALAHAYDIIVNGNELGGGSFRIHEPEIQARVFDLLALTPDEQRAKFGFLLDALAMGAPPHGGIALGIDRMTMVLAGEANLRDVIAFPKNQAGLDPMSGAPSEVTPEQLRELGIRLAPAPQPPVRPH